jgi:hypothetical protein
MTTRFCLSLVSVSLGVSVLGGCADRVFAPPSPRSHAAVKSDAQTKAQANAALEQLARAALSWSKEAGKTAQTAREKPRVWVDVAAVARQHPAWRLADALQSGEAAPAPVRTVTTGGFGIESTVDFDRTLNRLTQTREGIRRTVLRQSPAIGMRAESFSVQPAQVVSADALPEALEVARRRQANAFTEFLRDAAIRQKDARFDAAETLRSTLDDTIEAARRVRLDELVPFFPADEVGLELSNLRLRLLTASPAESAALQKRIDVLEAQWQARLRAQEATRLRELERLRLERPAQLRREGETRIKTFLAEQQSGDTALRNELQTEQRLRLAVDFTPTNGSLGIVLPAARTFRNTLPAEKPFFAETFRFPAPSERIDTARSALRSSFSLPAVRRQEGTLVSSTPLSLRTIRTIRTRELRAQAVREARLWTKALARRNAWTLLSRPPAAGEKIPNETARVIRALNVR